MAKAKRKVNTESPATDIDPELGSDELPGGAPEGDPDLPTEPLPGGDPDSREFRDELKMTQYGVSSLLEQEADIQQAEQERATLDALEAMRALDHGDSVKWRITRTGWEEDEWNGYLVTWPNSLMSIERICKKLGGGTYYLKGFRNGKYFVHNTVQVAGKPIFKPGDDPAKATTMSEASGGFNLDRFLAMQEQQNAQRRREEQDYRREQEERERKAEEREERRRSDRMQLLLTLGPAALTALGAMFTGRQQDLGPILAALKPPDPIQQIAALKALMPAPATESGVDTAIKIVEKLSDLGGLGQNEQGTTMLDVVKEFARSSGPVVGKLIEANIERASEAAQRTAQPGMTVSVNGGAGEAGTLPNGVIGSEPPVSPAPGAQEGEMSLIKHIPWLRGQLHKWVPAAERGKSPQVYGLLFVEESPEDLDAHVMLDLLSRPDWFEQLSQLDGRIVPHRAWFLQLHQAIVGEIQARIRAAQQPNPAAATVKPVTAAVRRALAEGEIDRPQGLPSLYGEVG